MTEVARGLEGEPTVPLFSGTGISENSRVFLGCFYFKPSQAIMGSTHLKVR
ncbi:hypothetical protein [Microcoleus sp. herbarium12]|uniref:hypothetical protein n=1 Tax=Microcoleus sp. herbarium12 TaxID=3055437 RepID=UPI002FD516EF